ncbi:hypothetical protein F6X38_11520 [Aureimonas leprariae]|uniref:DUF5666 domain-containing protein n=1 Tax=Plantimonas leprariae TaxID=2615207 RepID=A0A7V7TZZ4_9HYPH|nr:hypothetical protein F6X38_11520 [Aureimonas leprariae]
MALGVLFNCAALPAVAQDGQPTRVRGTIASLDGSTLNVDTREGAKVAIKLADGVAVKGVRAAKISDIKTGDFVGVASVPQSGGGDGAVEVLIFPAAMRGAGEGTRPWDVQPNSTMTNATVANAVTNVDGAKLTLKYPQGEKTVTLPDGIPVVTLADASTADLKPGNKVFVSGMKAADGTVATKSVVVGDKGVVPPM